MRGCGGLQPREPGQEQAIGQLNFGATLNALCVALRTRTNWVFVAAVVKNAGLTSTSGLCASQHHVVSEWVMLRKQL
jgi:hypothetical protein